MRMRSRLAAGLLGALALTGILAARSSGAQAGKTEVLFNGKDLKGWYTFTQEHGKNSDPLGIFKVEDGVLRVSGEKFGYLSTEKDYQDFRLRVDYKWGEKKWPPRENVVRDAGLLYHVNGPDMVWANCLELQIQERDTGDMFLIPGAGETPSVEVIGRKYGGGNGYVRVQKWKDYEKPHGQWNTVMVVARGDRFEHWVNGQINLVGKRSSLYHGRINLQSEGAEIFYRNVVLEHLE